MSLEQFKCKECGKYTAMSLVASSKDLCNCKENKKENIMKVSLAKALTIKSRFAGRLNEIFKLIQQENSIRKGQERAVDIKELLGEARLVSEKLIIVKTVIMQSNASSGVSLLIARLEEMKSFMSQLKSIDTKDGLHSDYRSEEEVEYEAIIKKKKVIEESAEIVTIIEGIQDQIDSLNATTIVEIDI